MAGPGSPGVPTADLRCSVGGVFRAEPPDAAVMGRFGVREAVVLIYPYLRASVGQIWRISGTQMPPLPTLDTVILLSVLDALETRTQPGEGLW